jgi:sigma-B regulation protein RsbU (phosphoserine phosphatase)
MIVATIDCCKGTLTLASSGHPARLIQESGGPATRVEVPGRLPLGIVEKQYPEIRLTMPPNSLVVVCSDGILESENKAGEEFGSEGLKRAFENGTTHSEELIESVLQFADGQGLTDDATAVMIRRTE